jgi:hypothetical protein
MGQIIEGQVAALFAMPGEQHAQGALLQPVEAAMLDLGVVTDVANLEAVFADMPGQPAAIGRAVAVFSEIVGADAKYNLETHLAWLASSMGVTIVLDLARQGEYRIPGGSVWGPFDPLTGKNNGPLFGLMRNAPPGIPPHLLDRAPASLSRRGWDYRAYRQGMLAVGQAIKVIPLNIPEPQLLN